MTNRTLVHKTLEFENKTGRVPRQLWCLPWAESRYPGELASIRADYPADIVSAPAELSQPTIAKGDPYALGTSTDEWGCVFHNLQAGIIGEVKEPIITDEDWEDLSQVYIPEEVLSFDIAQVNAFCRSTDNFVTSGGALPRPFERLQFLRGTASLYMDLVTQPSGMMTFIGKMHAHNCELLEKWASTEVDALSFMDDWGSQNNLLISPELWKDIFMPMYKDYIDIAHRKGKKAFMHSDGNILSIYPLLIDLGLDAINSQLFCMGVDNLSAYKGKITFWGEIDRQHLLPNGTKTEIDQTVRHIHDTLWEKGGCIAQCEFGPGAKPENVRQVYESWSKLDISS